MISYLPINTKKLWSTGNILVVLINYTDYIYHIPFLVNSLSEEEKFRSVSIVNETDRLNYIIRRAILKQIICRYFSIDLHDIKFDKATLGKPYCIKPSLCRFNIAHSKNNVAFIISDKYEVGIDIEYKNKKRSFEELAKACFTEDEYHQVINSDEKNKAFYKIWTAKEALLKADGIGLSGGIRSVNVADIVLKNKVEVKYRHSLYKIKSLDYRGEYAISFAYR